MFQSEPSVSGTPSPHPSLPSSPHVSPTTSLLFRSHTPYCSHAAAVDARGRTKPRRAPLHISLVVFSVLGLPRGTSPRFHRGTSPRFHRPWLPDPRRPPLGARPTGPADAPPHLLSQAHFACSRSARRCALSVPPACRRAPAGQCSFEPHLRRPWPPDPLPCPHRCTP